MSFRNEVSRGRMVRVVIVVGILGIMVFEVVSIIESYIIRF